MPFWSTSPQEMLHQLETTRDGLTGEEARRRLALHGYDTLKPTRRSDAVTLLLSQFKSPIILMLFFATGLSFFLRDPADAFIILTIVLASGLLGFWQERGAASAVEKLLAMVQIQASALRDGSPKEIPVEEIVPGDVVILDAGDIVPGDCLIIESNDLYVDEAMLTGETFPVEKTAALLAPDTPLGQRTNSLFMGTHVVSGSAQALVIHTGKQTEFGRVSERLKLRHKETEFEHGIRQFGYFLMEVTLVLVVVIFATNVYLARPVLDSFLFSLALAVGLTPQLLPAIISINLAHGAKRMAQNKVIVKRLASIENFGSMNVICSDKTGTLTQNQMTVQALYAGGARYEVTGIGYVPEGSILRGGSAADVDREQALRECLVAGLLCNDSDLRNTEGSWTVHGDPTEIALITAAVKGGVDTGALKKSMPRKDVIPFESQNQFMATLHEAGGGPQIYVKGAIEVVLGFCGTAMASDGSGTSLDAGAVTAEAELMAGQGLRVIAFAGKKLNGGEGLARDALAGMTLLGLQGMIDPPRPEALAAVKACQRAGIAVKMITGDHLSTARSIAGRLGILAGDTNPAAPAGAMAGAEIEALSDEALSGRIEDIAVFARVTPEQKLRLVDALQDRGHVVAMTGDGVNDAPALKTADIGIAMGVAGTEVAREAADMLLTDDNFATIEAAVEEGRGVFDNITKFIVWTIPTNLGEGLVILAAIFAGVAMPVLPVQILWINMTTAVLLGLMLAFEPKEPGLMTRPPRDPASPIITGALIFRIMLVGALLLAGAFGLFELEMSATGNLAVARTAAVNVFVMGELLYLFNCRSLTESIFRVGFFSNPLLFAGVAAMALLQLGFTYVPAMNTLFNSAPITLARWGYIMVCAFAIYALVGMEKMIGGLLRRRGNKKAG